MTKVIALIQRQTLKQWLSVQPNKFSVHADLTHPEIRGNAALRLEVLALLAARLATAAVVVLCADDDLIFTCRCKFCNIKRERGISTPCFHPQYFFLHL